MRMLSTLFSISFHLKLRDISGLKQCDLSKQAIVLNHWRVSLDPLDMYTSVKNFWRNLWSTHVQAIFSLYKPLSYYTPTGHKITGSGIYIYGCNFRRVCCGVLFNLQSDNYTQWLLIFQLVCLERGQQDKENEIKLEENAISPITFIRTSAEPVHCQTHLRFLTPMVQFHKRVK